MINGEVEKLEICCFCGGPGVIHYAQTDDREAIDVWLCRICARWVKALGGGWEVA